jgi:hypothetical protein
VAHLLVQAQPAAREIFFIHDQLLTTSDVVIFGFFSTKSGPLFQAYLDAAERTRGNFACHYVIGRKQMKEFKAKPGKISLYYPEVKKNRK